MLIHLSDFCITNGPLNNFSTFKFENYLGSLKGPVRSPNTPIKQIHNRIKETDHIKNPRNDEYERAVLNDVMVIGESQSNSFVLLDTGKVIRVSSFFYSENEILVESLMFDKVSNVYKLPFVSRKIDCFKVLAKTSSFTVINIKSFKRKMFRVPATKNCICFHFQTLHITKLVFIENFIFIVQFSCFSC